MVFIKPIMKTEMKTNERIENFINELSCDVHIPACVHNNFDNFIPGKTPVYYSGPYWGTEEVVAATQALLTGSWISAGTNVQEFENQFAKAINEEYAVMVNSGSSANLIMIAALKEYYNWKDNDEVIVSVVGFPTTTSVVVQNNLKPVFIDIEFDTLNFDLDLIEEKITDKTKAVFLSPVLGNPPQMDKLVGICNKHNLKLILDDCDSLGSQWEGKLLNKFAVASSHSFYAAHTISTGEGGMVVTSNKAIYNIIRSLVTWGRSCICFGSEGLLPNGACGKRFSKWLRNYDGIIDHRYVFSKMGYNLKPLDLQGAIGKVQIGKLDEIYSKRNVSQKIISKSFHHVVGTKSPKVLNFASPVWFGTGIICHNRELKEKLVAYLEENKIQTRNYFAGNLLIHPGYEHLGDFRDYPMANEVLKRVFFVGASPAYTEEVFQYFDDVLKGFYEK